MSTILCVIGAVIILGIFVTCHEFGHYFVGKKCGIGIMEFAVGFGPKLWSKVKNGTRYSLRLIPLGGFTQFVGEDEEIPDNPRAFNNAPVWKRFLTILAGPVMNLIFALLMAMIVLVGFGDAAPYIVEVDSTMPAYEAGLMPGDRIAAVDGVAVDFYDFEFDKTALGKGLANYEGESVSLKIERDGELMEIDVPIANTEDGRRIGISYGIYRRHFSFFEGLALSFKWMYYIIAELLGALWGLVAGTGAITDLGGIVYTVEIISEVIRTGWENIFRLAAMLSINLGIFNLLPFPALDGGRIVFLGIEKVTKKGVSRNTESIINMVGLFLLFALALVLVVVDIRRMIVG